MPTITFVPAATPVSGTQYANWSDPSVWSGGVVPNGPSVDVVTSPSPPGYQTALISIQASESFAVNSMSFAGQVLDLFGSLSVANAFSLGPPGGVDMDGGSLSVGSFQNNNLVDGDGRITSLGVFTNNGSLAGENLSTSTGALAGQGLTLTASGLVNNGGIVARLGGLTINVPSGGFTNLSAGVLTGGSYIVGGAYTPASVMAFNVGGVLTTDAAAITIYLNAQMQFLDPASGAYVPIQSSLRTISPTGALTLQGATYTTGQLTVDGTLTLASTTNNLSTGAVLNAAQLIVDPSGTVSGLGVITGSIGNAGVITATTPGGGLTKLQLTGPVTGAGVLKIAAGGAGGVQGAVFTSKATLELGGPVSQTVQFANGYGVLQLDAPSTFTGKIAPAGSGDQILLGGVSLASITGTSYTAGAGGGVLTLQQGGSAISLNFVGNYDQSSFAFAAAPQSTAGVTITVSAPSSHTLQALKTYYTDVMRVDFNAIPLGTPTNTLLSLQIQVDSGALTLAAADAQIAALAVNTTSVANMAYQFFTGLTPYASGLDYLVSPTGPNPNNLNSAYYQSFNVVNRFIDFAVNLGVLGEGQRAFAAAYGPLSMNDAVTQAYTAIFGAAPAAALVSSILNDQAPNGLGGTETRQQYFAFYGGDGPNGIGTKAAMVGWLLSVAATGDVGVYAKAEDAFLADLGPDGLAHFHTNLVTTYGPQPAGQPGSAISFNHDQSVSLTAANSALQSTNNNDVITGTAGLDVGQSVATGNGNDTVTIPGVVFGTVQLGDGNDTLTLGGLGATPGTLGAPAQYGGVALGSGNDTIYLNGPMAAGTSITAAGSDSALYLNGTSLNSGATVGNVSGFQTVYVETPSAEQTVNINSGLQTVYDVVPTGSTNAQVNLTGPDGTAFVLQNTSNPVMISYPQWSTTTSPAGAITRTPGGVTTAEIHLDNYAGAQTPSLAAPNGGQIAIAGGSQTSVVLHVDSNSTAGLISAQDRGETGSVVFEMLATSPIPNLTIVGLGSLAAQIDGGFTHVDASAAADLQLGYTARNQGSTFLFSNGTDTLNLNLQPTPALGANAAAAASKFVLGGGTDTLNLTTFQNLAIDDAAQTVNAPAEVDGFIKGVDHLNLNAGSNGLSANVQPYATGAATLTQALINISAHVAANTAAVFEYGGDTYVYQQDAVVGVDMVGQASGGNGDGLIRLVGVTGLSVVTGAATGDIHYG
jgi:hypothetical protein